MTYFYTDQQGTVVAMTDASANLLFSSDYSPYGSKVVGTSDSSDRYANHLVDVESGLTYMQARFYDPVGRFISAEPVHSKVGEVFLMNRYAYGPNSPLVNIDPDDRDVQITGSNANIPLLEDQSSRATGTDNVRNNSPRLCSRPCCTLKSAGFF